MGKRWLRYGLVGNFLVYGIGWGAFAYIAWIIFDIGENQSTKMDEDLAKEVFTFTDAELKESAKQAKKNFLMKKDQRLMREKQRNDQRRQENKRAEYI